MKLCLIAWYLTESKGEGVSDLGYRPGDSTGNYQKHLDCVLGLDAWNENLLELQMPGYCKHTDTRNLYMRTPRRAIDLFLRHFGLLFDQPETLFFESLYFFVVERDRLERDRLD